MDSLPRSPPPMLLQQRLSTLPLLPVSPVEEKVEVPAAPEAPVLTRAVVAHPMVTVRLSRWRSPARCRHGAPARVHVPRARPACGTVAAMAPWWRPATCGGSTSTAATYGGSTSRPPSPPRRVFVHRPCHRVFTEKWGRHRSALFVGAPLPHPPRRETRAPRSGYDGDRVPATSSGFASTRHPAKMEEKWGRGERIR
jgi:hypothetical protein